MIRSYKLRNGQSLVEFTLILPLLVLITVIILDLGRVAYYYSAVYNAAREGARYGIVNPGNVSIICSKAQPISINAVLSCVNSSPCDTSQNEVCVNKDTDDPLNSYIEVTVVYQYQPVTPLVAQFLGSGSLPIASTAKMKIEGIP